MKHKILLPALAISLSGCMGQVTKWTNEPFRVDESQAYATLYDGVAGPYEDKAHINITTPLDDCETIKTKHDLKRGILFTRDKSTTAPQPPVKVPAGKPFYIEYQETSSEKYCIVHVVVSLDAGKHYTLVGGNTTVKGSVPILFDKRGCNLGVFDNEAKSFIPYTSQLCK